jgi:hypothetical protein
MVETTLGISTDKRENRGRGSQRSRNCINSLILKDSSLLVDLSKTRRHYRKIQSATDRQEAHFLIYLPNQLELGGVMNIDLEPKINREGNRQKLLMLRIALPYI